MEAALPETKRRRLTLTNQNSFLMSSQTQNESSNGEIMWNNFQRAREIIIDVLTIWFAGAVDKTVTFVQVMLATEPDTCVI